MKKIAPVYCWLPGDVAPVLAGEFEWDGGQGRFTYDDSFLSNSKAVPLDPVSLPLRRSKNIEQSFKGIFGVFSDSSADAWGKRVLEATYGEMDEFDVLEKSLDDGVGAIAVGYPDTKKSTIYSLDDIVIAANKIKDYQTDDIPTELLAKLAPTTSIGGMKPKINIEYKGQMWLAKFIERGDSPYLPHAESAILKLGRDCGINTCQSEVTLVTDDCYAILVKRFDREKIDNGFTRRGFASAHTVLRVGPLSGLKEKSYIRLAEEMKRWVNSADLIDEKRELWRRVVFNALVGNADDHSKNHGLLQDDRNWKLSPAFDIVPFQHKRDRLALSMAFAQVNGKMSAVVSRESLLVNSNKFGYQNDEAEKTLEKMASIVKFGWRDRMSKEGMPDSVIDSFAHSFSFANEIAINHTKNLIVNEANIERGRYRGEVIDDSGVKVTQHQGKGTAIAHEKNRLVGDVQVGQKVEIGYKDGKGTVKPLEKGKDVGQEL